MDLRVNREVRERAQIFQYLIENNNKLVELSVQSTLKHTNCVDCCIPGCSSHNLRRGSLFCIFCLSIGYYPRSVGHTEAARRKKMRWNFFTFFGKFGRFRVVSVILINCSIPTQFYTLPTSVRERRITNFMVNLKAGFCENTVSIFQVSRHIFHLSIP